MNFLAPGETFNIERSTSNVEFSNDSAPQLPWKLSVECWALNVSLLRAEPC
jgi:hypothetical protein